MTRTDEIKGLSKFVYKTKMGKQLCFIRGAEWADRHPNKCLVDVNTAYRWLKDNAHRFTYMSAHSNEPLINEHQLAEEFVQAMTNNE
jgi:hypothetical protein